MRRRAAAYRPRRHSLREAKTVGERIDLAGLGLVTFGPEAVAPFLIDETVGTGLVVLGEGAELEAAIVDRFQNTTHVIGRRIKTAGKTMEHLGKKAKEDGSDIVDNYETAVGFSGGAYDKKEDKRDNVTLQGRTYERDKELSNQNNAVDVWKEINCEDPNDCNVYIAMKGTNIWHMKDLYYDWHIFKDSTENTDMYMEDVLGPEGAGRGTPAQGQNQQPSRAAR